MNSSWMLQLRRAPATFVPWFLAVALIAQATFLWIFMGACAGGADSSGYLNTARLLAHGESSTPVRPIGAIGAGTLAGCSDSVYTPLGFRAMSTPGVMSSVYPIGFPLLIMAMASATNWEVAAGLTVGLHALAAMLLVYALGRESGLSRGWSALGTLLLGVSPLFHFMSLETMSDVPALVWTTAGILCAWRAPRTSAWAFAAGFIVGFSVLVRPTNLLALLPAAIAVGWSGPRLLAFIAGGIPAAITLARYNLAAYGKILTTGYFNPPDSFALHRVDSTWWHYILWVPILLTPLVLAALLLPWVPNLSRRWKWVLGSWVIVFFGFYSTYLFTHMSWWFLRFLLPAFPPLIIAALHGLRSYSGRKPGQVSPLTAWIVVATMVFINGATWTYALRAHKIGRDERAYEVTASWLRTHLPPEAIVCSMQESGALYYYTDFTLVRWDALAPTQFAEITRFARTRGVPIYATLRDFEQHDAFRKHIPGSWQKVDRLRYSTIWRLDP